MQKNIVIAILIIIIAGLSISLYREKQFSKTSVAKMLPAVERYHEVSADLPSLIVWLRRHLEKTISILEAEHNLEPMPVESPWGNLELREELKIHRPPRPPQPFVIAYEKPEYRPLCADPNELGTEIGLKRLEAMINFGSAGVMLVTTDMETLIDNYYQRLQRLEPKIETTKK